MLAELLAMADRAGKNSKGGNTGYLDNKKKQLTTVYTVAVLQMLKRATRRIGI